MDSIKKLNTNNLYGIFIHNFEDLNNKEQGVAQYLFEQLKPSYESLLQVAYL